jgi:hypothetical protein
MVSSRRNQSEATEAPASRNGQDGIEADRRNAEWVQQWFARTAETPPGPVPDAMHGAP